MRSQRGAFVRSLKGTAVVISVLAICAGCLNYPRQVETNPAAKAQRFPHASFSQVTRANSERLYCQGQKIFRYDTFGSEAYWGGQLRLHEAILGEKLGGIGPGLTPRQALELGLKVDVDKLPKILCQAIKGGHVSLYQPKTTIELLKAGSVVGVRGRIEHGKLVSVGITCASSRACAISRGFNR